MTQLQQLTDIASSIITHDHIYAVRYRAYRGKYICTGPGCTIAYMNFTH